MGSVMSMGRAAVRAISATFVLSTSALVDIDKLMPTIAIDWVNPTGQLIVVNSYPSSTRATIAHVSFGYDAVTQRSQYHSRRQQ